MASDEVAAADGLGALERQLRVADAEATSFCVRWKDGAAVLAQALAQLLVG